MRQVDENAINKVKRPQDASIFGKSNTNEIVYTITRDDAFQYD
jgi:hypothetical protein